MAERVWTVVEGRGSRAGMQKSRHISQPLLSTCHMQARDQVLYMWGRSLSAQFCSSGFFSIIVSILRVKKQKLSEIK